MEALMQYVWQHRLWPPEKMVTDDGRPLRVIDPGRLNTGSGPDFFNAKIRIGDRLWAGDVEMHVSASDWHRHGHDGDRAYDSVILHVVDRGDCHIKRHNGETIPQVEMHCSPDFRNSVARLINRIDGDMPCACDIAAMSSLNISQWMTTLLAERLYSKSDRIISLLDRLGGDWATVCYVTLARALGFGINSEPMERLALSLPLKILLKHSGNIMQLEALLFGQAGFLAETADPYAEQLASEHRFLSTKFGLQPPESLNWKRGRIRPGNLPYRRIAYLAEIIRRNNSGMTERLCAIDSEAAAREFFDIGLHDYWERRFRFGSPSESTAPMSLSRPTLDSLIINVVVPVKMAFAVIHGCDDAIEEAASLLEELPSEENSPVITARRAGLPARSAADSQALLQLRRAYCETRKCLYCHIGHRMMTRLARRPG